MSAVLELAQSLIARPSITPDDQGCQSLIADRLKSIGFQIESMPFGSVSNLWAKHGEQSPLLCLAGHTDVVPTGPLEDWLFDPFQPTVQNGLLYGRGASDMKGPLAALVIAAEKFVQNHPDHRGSLAFLITSDEEGPAQDGTAKVIDVLNQRGEKIDYCLLGEPASEQKLGDVVKNGRRGSLNMHIIIKGKQGHVAYPHLAINPIHQAAPALAELVAEIWDQGNDFFPPTSFQISNIKAGTGAENVIPGQLAVWANFRFSTASTADSLKQRTQAILDQHGLNYAIEWHLSGQPFITERGQLLDAAQSAIKKVLAIQTQLSTGGGTSDGRFIAPTGAQVLELGPTNATIHKVNECVPVSDLDDLVQIYYHIIADILAHG